MTNPAYRVIVSDGQTNRVTLIFTSSTTWTVPDDWNSGRNWIEGIGGGGSGSFVGGCHGGGGGAYTLVGNVSLSPGGSVPIVIGAGGTLGSNGGTTTFNTSTLVAQGGYGGVSDAPGLGGQASLCIPSQTARSGGNGAVGSNQMGAITYYIGSAGGGGGGAGGPYYPGQSGGVGNIYIGGGGGGGAGGVGTLVGLMGNYSSGARVGGNGGAGPLSIGGGNGNIAIVYSVGAGGSSTSTPGAYVSGGATTVSVLGISITANGGSGSGGGVATSTLMGGIRSATGGAGGPADTVNLFECGGGGGLNLGAGTTSSGGQSIDFQGLRSVVENLGYSWTAPGAVGTYSPYAPGGSATGFGCGGGGGWYYFTGFGPSYGAPGGNGRFGGGGGGGGRTELGGSGGSGAVIIQVVTTTSTSNLLLSGSGVYNPPLDLVRLSIWAIGGGASGQTGGGNSPGPNATSGGGAGSIAYMSIEGGYQGGAGGAGGNGTVTANGWSNNTLFIGPGGGGGGGMLSRAVTDSIGPAQGTAGRGGYYGGGAGGGGGDYADGGPGLLVITYEPAGQSVNSIDVDDLLVLKSAVIPGNLSSVGADNWGQLGYSAISTSTLQQVGASSQWASLTAGYVNSGAITSSGNLFVWGNNGFGQLGLNLPTSTVNSSPIQVGTGAYKQIAWGGADTNTFLLALAANGNIWASGNNVDYRLGDGTNTNRSSLVQLAVNNNNWKSVVAGYWYSLALTNQGQLWGWGDRSIAWTSASLAASTPVQLGSTTWETISAGYTFAMALTPDGSLYGWGSNNFGQLGLGDTTNRSSPVRVGALGAWRAVACGRQHVIAIANNGSLWSWGNNSVGQLGIGVSAGSRSSPVQIGTLTTWQFVSAGDATSLALRADGTLWTWGTNTSGGLGLGDINPRSSPTQVGSNINWKTASMGQYHMLAGAYPYMSLPPPIPPTPPFALFSGGFTSTNTAVTDKYTYAGDIVAAGTALGTARDGLAAAGNNTQGIFGGGYTATYTDVTDKYTYSSDTRVAGTALGTARRYLAAVGNSTLGIFGAGINSTGALLSTNKYTYSSDVVAAGTVLGTNRQSLAAAGNGTVGIFGGGLAATVTAVTDIYTYSSDVVAAGTVLGTNRQSLAAAGNSTQGIFGGGFNGVTIVAVTDKYTYSNGSVATGTNLLVARFGLAAAGNSTQGIFGGGSAGTYTNVTDKYTYSGDTLVAGTVLGTARDGLAAASSQPGGF